MKAIVAMSENRAIGKNGALPWPSIKEDFKHFREFTMDQTLIVGWNTFNTLPRLKGRKGIVLDKRWDGNIMYDMQNTPFDSFVLKNPYSVGLWGEEEVKFNPSQHTDAIVAGGAKTYKLLMPYITEFYVTHVKGTYDADAFMPPFEHLYNNQEVIKEFDGHRVVKYTK